MLKGFIGVPFFLMVAWSLADNAAASQAAVPQPEADQVVSAEMKKLYMAAAAAPPQSPAQEKVILSMAAKASNGKELLLAMRAAAGAPVESQARSTVTARMMELGTLNQLIEYAAQYTVDPEHARPFVQRMLQLGEGNIDARVWYRIRVTASRLKLADLEKQAQARGDRLSGK